MFIKYFQKGESMKKQLLIGTLVTLLATSSVFAAGTCNTEEKVLAADKKWQDTLALHDPQKMADLYEKDAVLLGTFEDIPLLDRENRVAYFTKLYKKMPNIRVEYDKTHVKLLKEDAISTGLYTFIGNENGKEIRTPARFTFAYDSTDQGCVLIMHHSSVLPLEYASENEIK
jgi:uncharacterized protein (TIGR02246 family)